MGASASKPEAIQAVAAQNVAYKPPLGPPNPENPVVFFDIKLGRYGEGAPLGRIEIELKEDVCPKTTENFKQLALKPASEGFKGSRFHRIIPGFMCQGGDYEMDNGRGGRSIYGARFPDENFTLKHLGEGILSMANAGPNTNGSQFFLCVNQTPWLDGKHVVFGQVISGYNVVKAIEACGSRSGETSFDVMIGDCGVVPSSKGTTTTAALQQPVAAPRRATKPAARAAPAGALRQLSKHRRDALQGRRLVLSRRPCVATHGTAATAAVAPTRFLAIA